MNFEVAPDEFVMGFFDGGKSVLLRTRTLPARNYPGGSGDGPPTTF
jgi:hypothetical protein